MQPQEEVRLWQRLIDAETKIANLEKKNTAELELRVKTLEEARQRQIAFNTEVSNRLAKLEKPEVKSIEKPKSFWPW